MVLIMLTFIIFGIVLFFSRTTKCQPLKKHCLMRAKFYEKMFNSIGCLTCCGCSCKWVCKSCVTNAQSKYSGLFPFRHSESYFPFSLHWYNKDIMHVIIPASLPFCMEEFRVSSECMEFWHTHTTSFNFLTLKWCCFSIIWFLIPEREAAW